MNISALAQTTGVTTDTLRYYEKQQLLDPPVRQGNGYRSYGEADVARVAFIRSAQLLGFSLAEIREVIPRLVQGTFGRREIELSLSEKISQIDAHIRQLQALKKQLKTTFASLSCSPEASVSLTAATRVASSTAEPGNEKR